MVVIGHRQGLTTLVTVLFQRNENLLVRRLRRGVRRAMLFLFLGLFACFSF